ncbi:helix-turn-helix domain-containing protein [Streptomyces mashuensis]|uniref:helix-turn-helix domain-containing protein n=1 Tax=Streptomyces mashuensis TaxID=33904 RepID=UPI004032C5F0
MVRRRGLIPDHVRVVGSRAAIISDRRITGLSADVIVELVAEVGPLWHERHQAGLASRPRKRAVGAGAKHRLVFIDRLLATLVHLRHGATHDVLACWFGVDRSTITRAIGEVRPCSQPAAAPSPPASGSAPSPRSSVTSAPAGRPGSSTEPRSGSAGPPSVARTGRSSSPARTSRTRSRPWSSPMPAAGSCSVVQPSRQAMPTSPTPDSWAWSSTWLAAQRPCRDTTPPQVQEEPTGLVRARDMRPICSVLEWCSWTVRRCCLSESDGCVLAGQG